MKDNQNNSTESTRDTYEVVYNDPSFLKEINKILPENRNFFESNSKNLPDIYNVMSRIFK